MQHRCRGPRPTALSDTAHRLQAFGRSEGRSVEMRRCWRDQQTGEHVEHFREAERRRQKQQEYTDERYERVDEGDVGPQGTTEEREERWLLKREQLMRSTEGERSVQSVYS